jgi:hypothetical protein
MEQRSPRTTLWLTPRLQAVFGLVAVFVASPVGAEEKPMQSLMISGSVDAYYSYNFNKPTSRDNIDGFDANFDFYHNSFSLSQAEVVIDKPASEPGWGGYRLDLAFGPTNEWVHGCSEFGCTGTEPERSFRNLQQAYLTYATPWGPKVDFGKFVTHMGAEVIESQYNWNYTRGVLFAKTIPYYQAGLKVAVPINDMFFVNGYALNGWNNVIENNGKKTFGATVGITPIPQLPILLNWIGPEDAFGLEGIQVYEAIVSFNLNDNISFMVDYVMGDADDAAGDGVGYSGFAGYARWKMDPFAIALRYEMLDDEDALLFGAVDPTTGEPLDNTISTVTLTGETAVWTNLLARIEYRMDSADEKIYESDDPAEPEDSKSRVVVGLVYSF